VHPASGGMNAEAGHGVQLHVGRAAVVVEGRGAWLLWFRRGRA